MVDNDKLLEFTKDIVVAVIENHYISNLTSNKNNDNVIKATEEIFNKLNELNQNQKLEDVL